MPAALRRLWHRLRGEGGRRPPQYRTPADHVPGRAHLVFGDGRVVEADLDPEDRARAEYLARRAVAPPPPEE